ncbi:MAG: HutP family protein [Candidatus Muiribacteriaceae bacterium]
MKNIGIDSFLKIGENISAAKAAVMLSMVEDGMDDAIVGLFKQAGFRCVITRAGGRGDNLKDKLFRNSLTAAENSGVIDKTEQGKYIFFNLFSKLLNRLQSGIFNISGAGFKIGIARYGNTISIALSGRMGIPGLNIDLDVIEVESEYYN